MYIGVMIVNDELEKIQQLTTGWMIWGSNPGGGKVFHDHRYQFKVCGSVHLQSLE